MIGIQQSAAESLSCIWSLLLLANLQGPQRGCGAAKVEQLQGEIGLDAGANSRVESRQHKGTHYAECYEGENRVVVATDQQDVIAKLRLVGGEQRHETSSCPLSEY